MERKIYPVTWIEHTRPDIPGKKFLLALCPRTEKLMRLAVVGTPSAYALLWLTDFHVNEEKNRCEEGTRCLNVECPLNRTTCETYCAQTGLETKGHWFHEFKKRYFGGDRKHLKWDFSHIFQEQAVQATREEEIC